MASNDDQSFLKLRIINNDFHTTIEYRLSHMLDLMILNSPKDVNYLKLRNPITVWASLKKGQTKI